MAQVVRRRPLTTNVLVRSQNNRCEVCGRQSDKGTLLFLGLAGNKCFSFITSHEEDRFLNNISFFFFFKLPVTDFLDKNETYCQ